MESRDAAATLRKAFPSINVTDNDSPQEKFEVATKFIIDSMKKEKRNCKLVCNDQLLFFSSLSPVLSILCELPY
jgi:hypothetical protein